jgi:hypothetical protein
MLGGLETCRWDYMRMLAVAAEDEGKQALALGWRWLADNRKWPRSLKYGYHAFGPSATPLTKMPEHCLPFRLYRVAVRAGEDSGTGFEDDDDDILLESRSRDAFLAFLCTIAAAVGECLLRE